MHNSANKLFRWKIIVTEFNSHKHRSLPTTVIHKRFIYPKFFISISTLNSILATPIDKELKKLGYSQEQIDKHVEKHNNAMAAPVTSSPVFLPSDNSYMQSAKHNQIF